MIPLLQQHFTERIVRLLTFSLSFADGNQSLLPFHHTWIILLLLLHVFLNHQNRQVTRQVFRITLHGLLVYVSRVLAHIYL